MQFARVKLESFQHGKMSHFLRHQILPSNQAEMVISLPKQIIHHNPFLHDATMLAISNAVRGY